MRLSFLIALLATLAFASSAQAEARTAAPPGAVTQLLLLDGYRAPRAPVGSPTIRANSAPEAKEESLTQAVQRMWSQVRAYRRPGGAEFYVRGIF